jgi:hypothetical protein
MVLLVSYAALGIWRRRKGAEQDSGFRPRVGFTRLDGMASIALLLRNGSNSYVWAEEIEIFLHHLTANRQVTEPPCHGIHKIRQMVPPGDMIPISLSEIIYKAAGEPQREYSCVLSSLVRYRIGEERFEKNLENYKIRMLGLTASSVDRERKPIHPAATETKAHEIPTIAVKK